MICNSARGAALIEVKLGSITWCLEALLFLHWKDEDLLQPDLVLSKGTRGRIAGEKAVRFGEEPCARPAPSRWRTRALLTGFDAFQAASSSGASVQGQAKELRLQCWGNEGLKRFARNQRQAAGAAPQTTANDPVQMTGEPLDKNPIKGMLRKESVCAHMRGGNEGTIQWHHQTP